MTLLVVVAALLLLLFSGLPVAFSLAGLGTVMLMLKGLPLVMVAQNLHGAIGILIPPSIPLIVYGVITEESIGKLFLAGVGSGLLLIALFTVYGVLYATFTKNHVPSDRATWRQRRGTTIRALPTAGLAVIMLGGIYSGIFTPTEASAIGTSCAILLTTLLLRTLDWSGFVLAVRDSVATTIVLFLIVIGAKIFGKAATLYQVPAQVSQLVDTHVASADLFLIIVAGILLFIGLFLESLSMLLIMVPVLFPTVLALGVDPVWFGFFFVVLIWTFPDIVLYLPFKM